MVRRILVIFSLSVVLWGLVPPAPLVAQSSQRCFSETGYCIEGRIREFWESQGGLRVFGYPIGPQMQAPIEGKLYTVQQFERNRLELHQRTRDRTTCCWGGWVQIA